MLRLARLCLVVMIGASVGISRADRKDEGHAAEARAESAFHGKDYAKALAEYQTSYARYPKPYLLFHIGECYRLLGKSPEAVDAYKKYVGKVGKGPDRKRAVAYIAELEVQPLPPQQQAPPPQAPVVEAPAPQVQDTEAPPVSDEEIAKHRKQEEARHKKVDNAVVAAPAHISPAGYEKPTYRKAWPWIVLGAGVAAGVGLGCGLALGLPKFTSELPIGGPGAHAAMSAHVVSVHF